MRWEGGMRDASEEREDNKPLRGLVFQTILRRLIVSLDLLLSLFVYAQFLGQNSLSLLVM